ncbi:MAG TPA: hypothetical protein VG755_19550 [Nannocystaceae bacterium]|nr:hypothetical protein [Nannocystaceae bacterium]
MNKASSLLSISVALGLAACPAGDDGDSTFTNVDTSATGSMSASDSGSSGASSSESGAADSSSDSSDSGSDMTCNYACEIDSDCWVAGMDLGYICQDSSCALANPCTQDSQCIVELSGWSQTPCTMGGGECMATMQVCVDLGGGNGGCATAPSELLMCSTSMLEEVMVTNLDDGMAVTVCGNTSGTCNTDTGVCSVPCVDDASCNGLVCDTDSGDCVCESDDDCGDNRTCDVAAGTCSAPGCTTDSDCTNPFDGGTISCG